MKTLKRKLDKTTTIVYNNLHEKSRNTFEDGRGHAPHGAGAALRPVAERKGREVLPPAVPQGHEAVPEIHTAPLGRGLRGGDGAVQAVHGGRGRLRGRHVTEIHGGDSGGVRKGGAKAGLA